ncbi:MAG: DNA gyrase inhibitor YacG [Polyangiales bacterium]
MASCPTCKRPVPEHPFEPPLPFCSQRCKLADLHGWLTGRYVVSEPLQDGDAEALALLSGED